MTSLAATLSRETLVNAESVLKDNFARNAQAIQWARGIDSVAGLYAGQTVVVVGAGPSLDAALPALRETLCPIIACDRAARPLLAAGIVPAWVVAVEFDNTGSKKFEGLGRRMKSIPLAFDPLCCPETVENYGGPLYTWNRPNVVTNKGSIRMGTGVITYAVGLAEVLQAERIVLVGVDLAYPGPVSHASGVVQIDGPTHAPVEIPASRGGLVTSDMYLQAAVEELSAAALTLDIVQTSQEGAFIPNASHRPLSEMEL
jgi:hypothetical protein